jgi:chemotaxis methyl-accepting protein methylase
MPEIGASHVNTTANSVPDAFPVVGIGASAGGLDACRKLVDGLRGHTGLGCILVQHLDPNHESMLVGLLATHTGMTVKQAEDGMPIEPENIYVIPPGVYLSVRAGALHLSEPTEPHGARFPFDFLLRSLATEFGPRAICVVLSGAGDDGSRGILDIRKHGGRTIVQDPKEAAFDGMPRAAIKTGLVDSVLPVAKIAAALIGHAGKVAPAFSPPEPPTRTWLTDIVGLLRERTPHDFTLYRTGTLERRIERRMMMASIPHNDPDRYVQMLRDDKDELDLLAKDILINVTNFFRDPRVFATLADKAIPELIARHTADRPLRVWIAGCSTGEETYSLAMLFREQIAAAKSAVRLQMFASDVDAEAVAIAREGFYPDTIAEDVSPERLARFFVREDHGYRISQDLRGAVVFAVQDVLADPPFSRLDMISCRNLLIYLRPEAQQKVMGLFHFALRDQGILLLGSAETVGNSGGRFETVSKAERIYRHIGRDTNGEARFPLTAAATLRLLRPQRTDPTGPRPAALADLCRRLVIENYAPAAVLINRKNECLFSLGPTDLYLRVAPGHAGNDILTMARVSACIGGPYTDTSTVHGVAHALYTLPSVLGPGEIGCQVRQSRGFGDRLTGRSEGELQKLLRRGRQRPSRQAVEIMAAGQWIFICFNFEQTGLDTDTAFGAEGHEPGASARGEVDEADTGRVGGNRVRQVLHQKYALGRQTGKGIQTFQRIAISQRNRAKDVRRGHRRFGAVDTDRQVWRAADLIPIRGITSKYVAQLLIRQSRDRVLGLHDNGHRTERDDVFDAWLD